MKIIKNIVGVLTIIAIITAILVPRILGIQTGIIVLGFGIVLFVLGRLMHSAATGDVVNRTEFYGLAAFLVGTTMMTNDRVHEIISLMAQIGLTMN